MSRTIFQVIYLCFLQIFNMKEEFNRKVYSLREKKVKLVRNVHQLENQLSYLYDELPEDCRILPPPKPQLNIPKEFPERQYQVGLNKLSCVELKMLR